MDDKKREKMTKSVRLDDKEEEELMTKRGRAEEKAF
jgi:hypothetical protein